MFVSPSVGQIERKLRSPKTLLANPTHPSRFCARPYANFLPALPYSAGSACCPVRRGSGRADHDPSWPPTALISFKRKIISGSLRGGQEEYVEVMRVAFRYVRLKIEAKGLELYDPKSVGRLFM